MDQNGNLLTDYGLSDQARVLGIYIASLGDGEHEIPHERFQQLLHGTPTKKTVSRHLKQLQVHGYLDRQSGGRGHADRYSIDPRSVCDLNIGGHSNGDLNEDTPPTDAPPNRLGGRNSDDLNGTDEGDIGGEEDEGGAPARRPEISDRAEELIERRSDDLEGCRDTLRDYLHDRVAEDRHYPYVQKILGWMDGLNPSVFRKPDGTQFPEEGRTGVLADALNGLYAADESQYSRPVGDPDNLRTKIGIVIQQWEDDRGYGNSGGGGGSNGGRQDREHREFAI